MSYVFLCFSEFVFWEGEDYNTKGAVRAKSWWWGGARYSVMFQSSRTFDFLKTLTDL